MSVSSRLTAVFNSSPEIPFNDKSRLVFFSDCHRGDNGWADDFANNQNLHFYALEHYLKKGFTYFELGDGDELWKNRRFSDIRYAYKHIFWRLSEFYGKRRLYMLFGNHDREHANRKIVARTLSRFKNDRTGGIEPLFPGIEFHEGLVLRHAPSGGKIFLVHGFQGDLINDRLWKLGRFLVRNFWRPLQMLGVHDPTSPARNNRKRGKLERKIQEWIVANRQPVVFGHTHKPSFPKPGKPPFFNTGSCVHPRCITGIEIEGGAVRLIKWTVTAGDEGDLRIKRYVLAGPRKVKSLFGDRAS